MELSKLKVAQLNEAAAGAAIDTAGKPAPQHQKSLTTAAAQLMGLQDFADAQLNDLHPPHHQRNMFGVKDDFRKLKTFLAERAKQQSAPTDSAVPALAAGGAAAGWRVPARPRVVGLPAARGARLRSVGGWFACPQRPHRLAGAADHSLDASPVAGCCHRVGWRAVFVCVEGAGPEVVGFHAPRALTLH